MRVRDSMTYNRVTSIMEQMIETPARPLVAADPDYAGLRGALRDLAGLGIMLALATGVVALKVWIVIAGLHGR